MNESRKESGKPGDLSADEKKPAKHSLGDNAASTEKLEGIYLPTAAKPEAPFKPGPDVVRRSRNAWLALLIAQHSAATFDAWATRHSASIKGVYEVDPLMRPFAHSSGIYGAIQLGPAALDLLAYKMNRSQKNWVRKLWWVPQAAATAGFLVSGAHNLKYRK